MTPAGLREESGSCDARHHQRQVVDDAGRRGRLQVGEGEEGTVRQAGLEVSLFIQANRIQSGPSGCIQTFVGIKTKFPSQHSDKRASRSSLCQQKVITT